MPRVLMSSKQIRDVLIDVFKSERELYCVCPKCGEICRVSDLQIFYGKRPPKDWLERLEKEREKIEEAWDEFKENERQIRHDAIERALKTRIGKTIEQMVPIFPKFGHHPSDLRTLLTPIDFISFNGMFSQRKVNSITFIEVKTKRSKLSELQKSIERAIDKNKVEFKVYEVPHRIRIE